MRTQISGQAPHALVDPEARHRLTGRGRENLVIGTCLAALGQHLLQGMRRVVPQRA